MDSDELTCPKCHRTLGRYPMIEMVEIFLDGRYERQQAYRVYCADCKLAGPIAGTRHKARQLWRKWDGRVGVKLELKK